MTLKIDDILILNFKLLNIPKIISYLINLFY
jgi:hypothetical protein